MKTAFVLMALLSVAVVGCGKNSHKKSGGVFTSNSLAPQTVDGLILMPTYGGSAISFQSGSNTYQISTQSITQQAYQVLIQMYQNQGYVPVRQDQTYRYFRARVTGSCGNSYYGSYLGNTTNYQNGTVCTNGSVISVTAIQPF